MATAHGGQYAQRYPARTVAQAGALVFGAGFLLVGVAGFIPGITTNYGDMAFAGTDSEAELFGVFQVSVLHNIVHIAFGLLGLWAARAADLARAFLIGAGVIYVALFVYGMVIDRQGDANFIPVNAADDWLHLGLGLGMLAVGIVATAMMGRERQRGEDLGAY